METTVKFYASPALQKQLLDKKENAKREQEIILDLPVETSGVEIDYNGKAELDLTINFPAFEKAEILKDWDCDDDNNRIDKAYIQFRKKNIFFDAIPTEKDISNLCSIDLKAEEEKHIAFWQEELITQNAILQKENERRKEDKYAEEKKQAEEKKEIAEKKRTEDVFLKSFVQNEGSQLLKMRYKENFAWEDLCKEEIINLFLKESDLSIIAEKSIEDIWGSEYPSIENMEKIKEIKKEISNFGLTILFCKYEKTYDYEDYDDNNKSIQHPCYKLIFEFTNEKIIKYCD